MIFKHVCKKGDKFLTKIVFKEGEKEKWATTSEAVYNWAKKNFKENDVVDAQYTVKNGQYFVSKIMKPGTGGNSNKSETTQPDKNEYTCSDCGKELADNKYKKCYTCNKKNPSKTNYTKNTDTADAISRQNTNHATSRALIALQGQIDINNIYDVAEKLHEMFLRFARGNK